MILYGSQEGSSIHIGSQEQAMEEKNNLLKGSRKGSLLADQGLSTPNLKEAIDLDQHFLDAIPGNVVILDSKGLITAANNKWRRYAVEGGLKDLSSVDVGADYLAVCRRSAKKGDPLSKEVVQGIEGILEGRRPDFSIDYPCHSPTEKRWFLMKAAPFGNSLAVLHLDITRRKLAEEALQKARDSLEQRVRERTIELSQANQRLQTEIIERNKVEDQLRQALAEIDKYKSQLEAECMYLRDEIKQEHNFGEIIGQSEALRQVLAKISQIAPTDATALILGETGTGKELVARAIHSASGRSKRPLVKVNCAALPANLIESELFGHEKGAFTGAWAKQTGRFELADGGTIFLDEIGEMPLELQAKLLRVLQDKEFERLGSPRTVKVDVRVITATNRNLEVEVREGRFRRDLWYRINVFPITLPPLRQRKDDIPILAHAFAARLSKKLGKAVMTIPRETMDSLQAYSWPGNIRELENVIERAIISSKGPTIRMTDKPETPQSPDEENKIMNLFELEREHILHVLDLTRWKIEGETGAANILGLNPSTLRGRLRKLGIRPPWK